MPRSLTLRKLDWTDAVLFSICGLLVLIAVEAGGHLFQQEMITAGKIVGVRWESPTAIDDSGVNLIGGGPRFVVEVGSHRHVGEVATTPNLAKSFEIGESVTVRYARTTLLRRVHIRSISKKVP